MKFKCDNCDNPATIHLTEILGGKKIEKHLCENCAANEGITIKSNVPISQLLEDFILQTSSAEELSDLTCEVCGLSFSDFRHQGILGCPNDYEAFEAALLPLLERAQEGGTQHVGRVPHNADKDQQKHSTVLRLRSRLKDAIAAEEYEQAAILRDRIKEIEGV